MGRTRISADLKALEKMHKRKPRTPATRRISKAFAFYMWQETSFAEATGVQTMFEGKLRTCEALRVRACDIIFSSDYVQSLVFLYTDSYAYHHLNSSSAAFRPS